MREATQVPPLSDIPPVLLTSGETPGNNLGRQAEAKQALCTCDGLEDRFDALADDANIDYGWWSGCLRTRALCAQDKRSTAAMDLFRQVYAALVPRNETMVGETLSLVTDLIAIGVSAHQLLEVLLSDEGKADALQPLVVALRELVGEHVRPPKEIGEIAADIRKQFEVREKILQGRLPTAS